MIELSDLVYQYPGGKRALARANARLASSTTAILGPNGAGKSTLMSILATSRRPTSGHFSIDGQVISGRASVAKHRASLGLMPQQLSIFAAYTCLDFLLYVAWLRKVPKAMAEVRAVEVLEMTGLKAQKGKRVSTLSGGMRQRLGLAQAMVNKPQLLLLDEPTVGLDPEQRRNFLTVLRAVASDTTVCLATHLTEDVAVVADNVLVLLDGEVLFSGTTRDFCNFHGFARVTGDTVEASYIGCVEKHRGSARHGHR